MKDRGILYAASRGLRFLGEAIVSAESVRRVMPDVSITLVTDIEPLFGLPVAPFDRVIALSPETFGIDHPWAQGLLFKVRAIGRSPYARTIFLDTDTRVFADLSPLFDLLGERAFAAVPCTPETSAACRFYGPMFNSGVLAFRDDEKVRDLVARWE